jgi:short-subunit dehydrogenase involved in D-alanine esterification of teichoic acids
MNILVVGGNGGLGKNIVKNLYSIASNLIITSTNKKKIKLKKKISLNILLILKMKFKSKNLYKDCPKNFSILM